MIGATLLRPRLCTGSDRSLSRSLSPVDRRTLPRVRPLNPSARQRFRSLEAPHSPSIVPVLPAHSLTVSRKKPFNTQRLVPAPFNEFYPKCSGPTIPLPHAILPPEHFR